MSTPSSPPPSNAPATFVVSLEDAGKTLEALVRQALNLPWGKARDLIRSGRVYVEGARVDDSATRMRAGMEVEMRTQSRRISHLALQHDDIAHLDDDIIIVKKASGVLTVPTEDGERDTLADRARAYLRGLGAPDGELGVVHRLDRDTSGLICFARNYRSKRILDEQFREHSTERNYVAIVHGLAKTQTIESELLRDRGDGLRGSYGRAYPSQTKPHGPHLASQTQRACTHVELLENLKTASLIRCRLETGRQHQIRIHLSEAGNALLGETVYIRDHRGTRLPAPRLLLHSERLGLTHPTTGARIEVDMAPPEDFQNALTKLRRQGGNP